MRGNTLVPSTVGKVLICIDEIVNYDIAGRIYNMYMPGSKEFLTIFGCINMLDAFFDNISFPQAYYAGRTFSQKPKPDVKQRKNEVQQYMSEDVMLNEKGKKATFMVQVQFRQNATWQGTITWMDEKKTQRFRSTLEMIKLMDGALSEEDSHGAGEHNITWE